MLVGRDEEIAAIAGLLDAPRRLPCAAMLRGEAGIGKTTLWLASMDMAVKRGYRVMSARPSEAEGGFSYAGLADLLGAAPAGVVARLPPVQRYALETVLLLGEPAVAVDERAVAAGFLSAVRLVAAEGPVCIAIDDVQWLDAASFTAVNYALDRLTDEPVLALLAERGNHLRWPRRMPSPRRLHTIEIGGLSVGEVNRLLRARLGATFPRPALVKIWEASAGNPFVALELAAALRRTGRSVTPGADLPIPSDLNALLHGRLAGLSPAAVAVAQTVAALGDPTCSLVESAVGRRFGSGLVDLLEAGVLEVDGERLRFTHPLLASAMRARLIPHRKRLLHTKLARLVPSPEEKARHLALAAEGPDEQVAAVLEEAARVVRSRGAAAAAAELAEHALRLTPNDGHDDHHDHDDAVRRRTLLAADMHRRAGDGDRAKDLLTRALESARPGPQRATLLASLAATLPPSDSIPLYYQALSETDDDAFTAEIQISLGSARYWAEGFQARLDHAELAVRAAERSGDTVLRCRALAMYLQNRFWAGHGIDSEMVREAMALERSLPAWPINEGPTEFHGVQLFWCAEIDRCREIFHEVYRAARLRKDPEAEGNALWQLGFIAWRAGDWDVADRYLTEALDLLSQFGDLLAPLEFPVALVSAYRGDLDAAWAISSRGVARGEAQRVRIAESGHSFVLGFIELSRGDAEPALVHLRRSYAVRNLFMLEPAQRLELGDLLEALIAVGEMAEAEEVLALWQERALRLDRAWARAILARCHGLLCAARGDFEAAFAAFDEALTQHARCGDPFQHARTLLALGRTRRRAKQRATARATLDDAIGRFQRLGARVWAQRAAAERARIGGREPSRGVLTEAEHRMVALVAQGRSNREIAGVLFLTEHSVETALSRVYRKLGVRGRAQLAQHTAANS